MTSVGLLLLAVEWCTSSTRAMPLCHVCYWSTSVDDVWSLVESWWLILKNPGFYRLNSCCCWIPPIFIAERLKDGIPRFKIDEQDPNNYIECFSDKSWNAYTHSTAHLNTLESLEQLSQFLRKWRNRFQTSNPPTDFDEHLKTIVFNIIVTKIFQHKDRTY